MAAGRSRRGRRGGRWYAATLLVVVLVLGAMAAGPLGDHTAATARVDELAAQRDALTDEVAVLSEQRDDLNDPETLELLARSELGLVRPGEIPYIVITPEPSAGDAPVTPPTEEPRPWYERLFDSAVGWLR